MSEENIKSESLTGFYEDSTGAPVGHDPKNPGRDAQVSRMGTASIPRLITEFAIPAIFGMLVNGAYNIIDSIFLGQAMGEIGLSTATVASPIMIAFMALSMLVGAGGNALAALRLGEGRRIDAEKSLGNTVFLSLVMAIIIALAVSNDIILGWLLDMSSATDEVRPYAESFLRIISYGFIFQCFGMGVNNFIRTAGAPNRALLTMVVGAVFCTLFNYLFVIRFGWGVQGSALATIAGEGVSAVTVLWYFVFTKNVPLRLHLHLMRPEKETVCGILSLGLASFAIQIGAAVVSFATNFLLVKYGALSPLGADDALASIGMVQRVAMFVVLPLVGVSIAIQPLLGFNYGAKNLDRVRKTLWYGVAGATVIGTVLWAAVVIFPEPIVSLFGIHHESLREFTIFALRVQVALIPIVGFQVVGSNYFQATGQPLKSILLSLSRQIIFLLPLMFGLPHVLPLIAPSLTGLDALYFAVPISDFLSVTATAILLAFEMKRLKRLERGEISSKY